MVKVEASLRYARELKNSFQRLKSFVKLSGLPAFLGKKGSQELRQTLRSPGNIGSAIVPADHGVIVIEPSPLQARSIIPMNQRNIDTRKKLYASGCSKQQRIHHEQHKPQGGRAASGNTYSPSVISFQSLPK